jgi:hypothetical protein
MSCSGVNRKRFKAKELEMLVQIKNALPDRKHLMNELINCIIADDRYFASFIYSL